ncbi:MAG TPA: hypothetical protein VFJ43_01995, partial [Bacteroidia bacterium]|nr:hypothetical protein [Bacteroidia bacterium]
GNLVDSGKKTTDFLPSTTVASDIPFTPNGDITSTNVQGAIVEVRDDTDTKLSFKADKVVGATLDDLVKLDAFGNLVDSGKKTTDFLPSTTVASDIPFTPNGDITSTNVQGAIVEVRDDTDTKLSFKADKVVGATLNDIAILNASGNLVDGGKKLTDYLDKNNTTTYTPSGDYNPATKKYVDDLGLLKADKVVGATLNDIAILNASGNLVDGGKKLTDYLDKNNTTTYTPSGDYNPATKKYVDDLGLLKADKVVGATLNDIAILSSTGNLVDGGKKLTDYLDKNNTTTYTPSGDYNPATKKYVDDLGLLKADKVVGAVTDDIAVLSSTGNLVDGGKKLSDYLSKTNTTSYTPTNDFHPATKIYVDNKVGAVPAQQKIVVMPFTFDTAYGTTSSTFARIPAIQIIVPAAGDVFPGTTTITAQLYVDYLTQSSTTTGEAGLTEWNFSGPAVSLVGTAATLAATNNVWQKNTSPASFTLPGSKTYQVIARRTAGTGASQVQIESATLVLTFS